MKVRDISTKDPRVINPDATICEAARIMKQCDIGMLPVCDRQRLVGSITDRDLAIRAIAEGCDPLATKVKDIMTPSVFWCFDDQDIEEAAKLMEEKQVRRLPIVNRQKRLVGIVSLGDMALRSQNDELTEEVLECVSQPA
ncbi:MAG: CBS domain-containing protein [Verrucomicrobia subdivision 3 bacterium]|nr:CBS domain-containing protein [Limisphaerales bacterium]